MRRRWRGRFDGQRAAFHVSDRSSVAGGLGVEELFQAAQPGALRVGVGTGRRAVIDEPAHRRQRTYPGLHIELAQAADEGDQIAAGAGAAGEIVIARLDLVPAPRNGELHRIHADILKPHQFALPQIARAEVIREFDRLYEVARGWSGGRGQGGREEQQQSGQALQNCLPLRTR